MTILMHPVVNVYILILELNLNEFFDMHDGPVHFRWAMAHHIPVNKANLVHPQNVRTVLTKKEKQIN